MCIPTRELWGYLRPPGGFFRTEIGVWKLQNTDAFVNTKPVWVSSQGACLSVDKYEALRGTPGRASWWVRCTSQHFFISIDRESALKPFNQLLYVTDNEQYTLGCGSDLRIHFTVSNGAVVYDPAPSHTPDHLDNIENKKPNRPAKVARAKKRKTTMSDVLDTVKDDALAAGGRVATYAFLQTVKPAFVAALHKGMSNNSAKKTLVEFFDTPLGEMALSHLLSVGLHYAPINGDKVEYLKKELRVSGMVTLGEQLIAPMLAPLQAALRNFEVPKKASKTEIKSVG